MDAEDLRQRRAFFAIFLALFVLLAQMWFEPNMCWPQPYLNAAALMVPLIGRPRWPLEAWAGLILAFSFGSLVLVIYRMVSVVEPSFLGEEWAPIVASAGLTCWFAGVGHLVCFDCEDTGTGLTGLMF